MLETFKHNEVDSCNGPTLADSAGLDRSSSRACVNYSDASATTAAQVNKHVTANKTTYRATHDTSQELHRALRLAYW